jgi:hypothetical protein
LITNRDLSGSKSDLRASAGLVLKTITVGLGLALALIPLGSQAQTVRVPNTYSSALTPAQITALSANPNQPVIIILRNQHPEVTAKASTRRTRDSKLAADQTPILSELRTLRAPAVHGYSVLNAVAATVSRAEAVRLATNPAVAAVVPDSIVSGPSPAASLSAEAAVTGGRALPSRKSATSATDPAQQVCPSNPAQPLLEPEALALMNVDFGPGATQPAAHDLATGRGVKIAVFPDGLDPTIPDFQRGGTSAIFDYQDFSGEGLFAVTGGGEAFGDASSLISQGTQVYDLSGEVNPAHPLPVGCNIRIEGVAPGASVAVMKVFGNSNFAFNSEIITGIEYALTVDNVDILSQSFGGNPVPNPGTDPIALLDTQAVAAGVTVIVSSGDAGTTNTIGSPSDAPGVISTGATTSYQLYAQTGSYGYQLGTGGWRSNEVSAFSSSGDTEYGPQTIDVVAPGESGWSDCSKVTDTATYTNCTDQYNGTSPQPIEAFGGTSESCPLTAGTAALVIQAYRDTHRGATPSPELVKQIIMSTATDLHIPAQNQGAGLVNALQAVQMARSIQDFNGTPPLAGGGLLLSPNSIASTAAPGHTTVVPVKVTNTDASSITVSPTVRVLGAAKSITAGTLTLNPATDPTFVYQNGATVGDVHQVTFNVPAGVDRLVSRIAWLGNDGAPGGRTVRETLFDSSGRMVAQSRPQGPGGGFGEDEIHNPAPGRWTLVVFDPSRAYNGLLSYAITGARFQTVHGAVSPASKTLHPGASATFHVKVSTPSSPGDRAEAVVFSTSMGREEGKAGLGAEQGTIPITTRALVPLDRNGGSFKSELTGGNARMAFYGQELVQQFDVPRGRADINIDVTVDAPGYQLYGFLVDPNMSPVDVQGTSLQDGSGTNLQTLHLTWANPVPGRWTLDLTQINGIQSMLTSVPVSGRIRFDRAQVSATGLPDSNHKLANGVPVTATIHIVNKGNSPAEYSIDPRLNEDTVISLNSVTPTSGALPIASFPWPLFVVPPFSSKLSIAASSTVPINFDSSPNFGYPDVLSVQRGTNAVVTLQAPDIAASLWSCTPTEITTGLAVSTTYSCGADATTKAFDPAVDSSTGNIWSALEGTTATYNPLVLLPGQSGNITVTITPNGSKGTNVSGFLAVETFNFLTDSSDQLVNLPYKYKIG